MAWPLDELTVLVRAIDARDVSTVARYVNFDRVRASLTEQMSLTWPPVSRAQFSVLMGRRNVMHITS
jgi:hypothetical protein